MIRGFFVLCIFLLSQTAQVEAQESVELRAATQRAEVTGKIWYLYEADRQLSIEEVLAAPGRFQHTAQHRPHFGNAGPVVWMRLEVMNTDARDGEWLLATRLSNVNLFEMYLVRDGAAELVFSTTNKAAAAASLKRYDMVAAPFALAAGGHGTLFIRFHGDAISRIPMAINSFEAVAAARQQKYVIFFSIAASVGALAFYSCGLFLILGGRAILYYAGLEVTIVLLLAQFYGILNIHLWPDSSFFRDFAPAMLNGLNVIFTSLFVRNFFRLQERSPWADWGARGFIYAAIAYFVLSPLLQWGPDVLFVAVQYIPYVLGMLLWLLLPPLALYATLRWRRSFWPLIPGWTSVMFAQGYWTLIILNLAPEPPFHPQWLGLNAIIQAIFLAMAIVLEVRQLRDDRLRAQFDLNAALQQQLAAAHQKTEILRELAEQDRLVHAAVHDSRSILLGLRNFAAGLQQGTDAAHVGIAAQAITHLTNDLEAVLSTTIASAAHGGGESVLALEMVPVAQMLAAVRLIHERTIRDKGLRFSVHGGAIDLVTDRPLLVRILGNLVDNACKYTEHGGIILAARRHGDILRIQVWDSGCGVAPDLLKTLLDPRVGPVRASELGAGQGTGLQTAKALASRIGASITACSRPSCGGCFEVRLPLGPPVNMVCDAGERCLWILENTYEAGRRLASLAHGLGLTVKCILPAMMPDLFGPGGVRPMDFVLIDYNFDGMNMGLEAAQRLAGVMPQANIFIKTYDRGVDVRARVAARAGVVLYEPFTREALRMAIYAPKPSTSAME